MFSWHINWLRVYGMILRSLFYMRHNYDRLFEVFYWPIIDLMLWGLTSQYFQAQGAMKETVFIIVSSLIFWMVVNRTQHEVSLNILAEMWDGNLINMFVSPLTFTEWLTSTYIISILKMVMSLIFATIVAFFFYHINLFQYGWYIVPLSLVLTLTGWVIGNMVAVLLFLFGTKIQAAVWAIVALISPFAAIYYPLSTLPSWAQTVSQLVPASYVFENGRKLAMGEAIVWSDIYFATGLAVIYLLFSFICLRLAFILVLKRGLLRSN